MKKAMANNRIINGTHGKLTWDADKLGNVKNFEVKIGLNYEEVNISEELSPSQKYMGYTVTGTIVMHKIDSFAAAKLSDMVQSGVMEEGALIGALEDPAAYGHERVEVTGITFDEFTLMKFETNTVGEEELPFKGRAYRFLDKIE